MKRFLIFCLIASPVWGAELVDRIVAIVGGEMITASDLKMAEKAGEKNPLEAMIRKKLLEGEMERAEITVQDGELADAIREVMARNQVTLPQLKEELAKKGMTYEGYKEELRREVRKMKFLGKVILPRIRISEEELLRELPKNPTEEDRIRTRQRLMESKLSGELANYLDEVRRKTFVEIKK